MQKNCITPLLWAEKSPHATFKKTPIIMSTNNDSQSACRKSDGWRCASTDRKQDRVLVFLQ